MIKMLRKVEKWKCRDVLRDALFFYDFIEFLLQCGSQPKNCYILIRFDVFSFWYVLLQPLVSTETTSTRIPRIASSDYVPQRIEDNQTLVTKGSIVELRATDVL